MHFYGLFGRSLAHSISPEIHKKIYEVAKVEAAYKKMEIRENELESSLEAMKLLGVDGTNVTIPYKEVIIPLLDKLAPEVKKLGAVNTIKNNEGVLEGYNTDYDGIALTFEKKNWQAQDKTAYILGSGGASHAVAHYFNDHGAAEVIVVSRTPQKQTGPWEYIDYKELAKRQGDFIVNSTPVGMYPNVNSSPVDREILSNFHYLFDMTYNPVETLFLEIGNGLGKETENGLNMLVGQAIHAVQIWEDHLFSVKEVDEILDYFQKNGMDAT